jgi:glycosyltransferase involved in cell wall biosynthesis
MHVVIVGDYPRDPENISGGVEAVIYYLANALQQFEDLQISVVTLDRWNLGERTVIYNNIPVHYIRQVRLPSRLSFYGNIRQLREKLLSIQPDIVHAHIAGQYAEAAAKTRLPWVLTLHGIRFLEAALWQSFLSKLVRRRFIKNEEFRSVRNAKHIISISPFIQQTFKKNLTGKIYSIDNPVDEAFFNVEQKSEYGRILFVGRLILRKGVHTLLQAFADLNKRYPKLTLRLAGSGISSNDSKDYCNRLKQFVADSKISKAVTFLGEINRTALLEEYSKCSVFVLSSVLETAPVVIMEAMAAGKPVVSTDAGGARYLVKDGQSGFIVPVNNAEALATALERVFNNDLHKLGQKSRKIALERFHATVVAKRTRDVYFNIFGQ